jgi:diaminohydroxyphosphoribosylaminopyrimidine deaminase / 5-amino-6-(5-phosphoribosylamino)uracil reductase
MDYALRLGRRALGTTAENPPVGCVIVKEGRVLAVGSTAPGGRPHAETQALALAGKVARGATAYVTLEPCAHDGRTPSCAKALAAAGIVRVITAVVDPDPRTSGEGHRILQAAGVEVKTGLLAIEAHRDLAGFLTRISRKRPYVTIKLALSADGKISAGPGQCTTITGPEAKARVHLWRSQSDAILVGRSTVEADDPELTCRLPGLEARSPLRLILSTSGALPAGAKLAVSAASVPTWILSGTKAAPPPNVELLVCHRSPRGVDIVDALTKIAARCVNRLLVEGGAQVAQSFLAADLVDDIRILQGPVPLGPQGIAAGISIDERFNLVATETLGQDSLSVYERVR